MKDLEEVRKSTRDERVCELFGERQVVFLTAQKLLNVLASQRSRFTLSQLDMLILDECHHTADEHAYNHVMRSYRRQLEDNGAGDNDNDENKSFSSADESGWMPIVVGLTASLGVGRSNNALAQLIRLCVNMECRHIACLTSKHDLADLEVE